MNAFKIEWNYKYQPQLTKFSDDKKGAASSIGSLCDLQDLYNLEPLHRFVGVLSTIEWDSILYKVNRNS